MSNWLLLKVLKYSAIGDESLDCLLTQFRPLTWSLEELQLLTKRPNYQVTLTVCCCAVAASEPDPLWLQLVDDASGNSASFPLTHTHTHSLAVTWPGGECEWQVGYHRCLYRWTVAVEMKKSVVIFLFEMISVEVWKSLQTLDFDDWTKFVR